MSSTKPVPLRILVIEDDADQRRLVRAALVAGGHIVAREIERGDDPSLLADPDVDVAVVDLNLPGMGGIDVIRALLDKRPSLPVLVLSASAHSAAITEALLAGALGYVVKGARFQELLDSIEMVARRRPALSAQAEGALRASNSEDVDRAVARVRRWL